MEPRRRRVRSPDTPWQMWYEQSDGRVGHERYDEPVHEAAMKRVMKCGYCLMDAQKNCL